MKNTYYTYREANDAKELLSLLQLRYKIYRNSRLKGFCTENNFGIDLDKFDCYARHFGLFKVENGEETPVGYMRAVQEEVSPAREQIRAIALSCSWEMLRKVEEDRKVLFPLIEYFPGAENVSLICKTVKNKGGKIGEASRFVFDPTVRSLGLARFVIESTMSIYMFVEGYTIALISCFELHAGIYKHYGFRQVENTRAQSITKQDCTDSSLLLFLDSKQSIPERSISRIQKMASTFIIHKKINFYPSNRTFFGPIPEKEMANLAA